MLELPGRLDEFSSSSSQSSSSPSSPVPVGEGEGEVERLVEVARKVLVDDKELEVTEGG